jgi:hypothetical protein
MSNLDVQGNTIKLKNNIITFPSQKVKEAVLHGDYVITVFSYGRSDSQDYFRNVVAVDLETHQQIWQVEGNPDQNRDYRNPYVGIAKKLCTSDYIVLIKLDSWKVAVDPKTGKILTDIDLNTGQRPW